MCVLFVFFFSSRRRHTRCGRDWSSDVCSSDLQRVAFDWVVVATGFDPLWFWRLLGERARAALADALGSGAAGGLPPRTTVERAIGHDLAVTGLSPRLHLPVLAGVAQGPGFPNLSCLGLLSDRVLGAYTVPMTGAGARATDAAATGSGR